MNQLSLSFYQRTDVVQIAQELLGKFLFTNIDNVLTGGMIVETEAYKGPEDKGSHAYNNKLTERNRVMYEAGGVAYVYICYGIHDLFNVVTGSAGSSHAVLIRAIEPTVGIEAMLQRRNLEVLAPRVTAGPGALGKALGITKELNKANLLGDKVWIEDNEITFTKEQIAAGPRIGMNFDGPYKTIPWRFWVQGNKFVSKTR